MRFRTCLSRMRRTIGLGLCLACCCTAATQSVKGMATSMYGYTIREGGVEKRGGYPSLGQMGELKSHMGSDMSWKVESHFADETCAAQL